MRTLTVIGVVVTAAYLVAITTIMIFRSEEFLSLRLNEVGDFLAGLLSPLAIFWIVLGFFQQGRELRNSVEALKLQSEELKNSVEQQSKLAQVSEEQLRLIRREALERAEQQLETSRPKFTLRFSGGVSSGGKVKSNYVIKNVGAIAYNVRVRLALDSAEKNDFSWPVVEGGDSVDFTIEFSSTEKSKKFDVEISSTDERGEEFPIQAFKVSGKVINKFQ